MKFYSSPTKTLKPIKQEGTDPFFPKETKKLINELQTLDLESLKKFYRASDKIVNHQYQNLKTPQSSDLPVGSIKVKPFVTLISKQPIKTILEIIW